MASSIPPSPSRDRLTPPLLQPATIVVAEPARITVVAHALDGWATDTSEGLSESSESIVFSIDDDGVVTALFKPGLGHDMFPDIERCCTRDPLLLSLATGVSVRITDDHDNVLYEHGEPSRVSSPQFQRVAPNPAPSQVGTPLAAPDPGDFATLQLDPYTFYVPSFYKSRRDETRRDETRRDETRRDETRRTTSSS